MNIGEASQACGLPSKTIRYYEGIGLVVPSRHEDNSYRVYAQNDIAQLRFLQRARAVGFSLEECRELLALYANPGRRCVQVKALVNEKIVQMDRQLGVLQAMRDTLSEMANECAGDNTSDCAIINQLADTGPTLLAKVPAMAFTLVDVDPHTAAATR